jgi:hypothetical protein
VKEGRIDQAALARGKRIWRSQRDRSRGYSVSYKMLAVAYAVEAGIISASLYASWVFATKYAGELSDGEAQVASLNLVGIFNNHSLDWRMAMAGGVAIAFAETLRLPLVQALRTQRSYLMRALAIAAVLMMAFVTTKTMAQVMQQTYAPRLHQVQQATRALKEAEDGLDALKSKRDPADSDLQRLEQDVRDRKTLIDELNSLIEKQGQAPRPVCSAVYKRNSNGVTYKAGITCSTPKWAGQQFADQRDAAKRDLETAIAKRDALAATVASQAEAAHDRKMKIDQLHDAWRAAVDNSVVHGLAATFYGVDPIDLTEGQVNAFLRLFILVPSVMIALASSILVMLAYNRIRRTRKVQPIYVELPAAIRDAIGDKNSQLRAA